MRCEWRSAQGIRVAVTAPEGRQDALPALILEQTDPLEFHVNTFYKTDDVRHIASLTFGDKSYWILAQNDDNLLIINK